jgi:3-deoxy-D-manno-octulosonic-acid transferase
VRHSFPSIKVTAFMAFYRLLWLLLMPVVLLYLKRRARREPMYIDQLGERFGFGAQRSGDWAWIHAVSRRDHAFHTCGSWRINGSLQ